MSEPQVTRREFLERVAILGAAVGAAPLLAACGTDAGTGTTNTGSGQAGTIDCTDPARLTDAEVKTRTDLQYVEASAKPDQNCLNCQQYTVAEAEGTCGKCTLVPGPINPVGWCISWVQKVA